MTRLINDGWPPLTGELREYLQKWPGDPSLAVVGQEGPIAGHDTGQTYRLASVTKLLTALTILDAAESGEISLHDQSGPKGATVLHLLAHASGINFEDGRVKAPVGSRRIYSNAGIDLAAEHLTAATGKDFKDEMRDRVLEPLGMLHTTLRGAPSKGAEGTITDIALLAHELLRPKLFAGPVEKLATLAYPNLSGFLPGFGHHLNNDWGAGAEIRGTKSPHWTSPNNSPGTFGHFGVSGSFLWVDRQAGIACAALSTVDFDEWATRMWPETSTVVLSSYSGPGGKRPETTGTVTQAHDLVEAAPSGATTQFVPGA
ncbi:serine hydrolase domain-containing protein [Pseudarthrobacter sp. NPDC080039]|uniref:serine hydrolase domain-containing protein n=1 Tax=unclassified Pseudarthrobacter TaxID=2647000 RepID=UPI00345050A5